MDGRARRPLQQEVGASLGRKDMPGAMEPSSMKLRQHVFPSPSFFYFLIFFFPSQMLPSWRQFVLNQMLFFTLSLLFVHVSLIFFLFLSS